MADQASPERATASNMPHSPSYLAVYSNGAKLRLTPWDLTIVFTRGIDQQGVIIPEDQVEVTCSPAHMKALVSALTTAITAYEERFGEIKPVIESNLDDIRALVHGIQIGREKT